MDDKLLMFRDHLITNIKKHSPEILAGLSVAGVVASNIMSAKAGIKAKDILDEKEREKAEELTKYEKIMYSAHCYIPTVLISSVTAACMISSTILNKRRYDRCKDVCISAYALLNTQFQEYKNKVKEVYGEEGEEKISKSIMKDEYKFQKPIIDSKDLIDDNKLHLFYDPISHRYFEREMIEMTNAAWELNRKYAIDGDVNLNYYYELLRLEPTTVGYVNGWNSAMSWELYGYAWIDILYDATVLDDGLVCYILRYVIEPSEEYMVY